MTEQLASGWWRCECDVDCNCGNRQKYVKRLHPPELSKCAGCGEYQPAKMVFVKISEDRRAKQREEQKRRVRQAREQARERVLRG